MRGDAGAYRLGKRGRRHENDRDQNPREPAGAPRFGVIAGIDGGASTSPSPSTATANLPKPSDPTTFGADGFASPVPSDRFTLSDFPSDLTTYRDAVAGLSGTTVTTRTSASPAATAASPPSASESAKTAPQAANGGLPNDATIRQNGYSFTTDSQGRVVSAEGKLSINPDTGAARSSQTKAAQRTVGWADRLSTDHGGHLIADRFNGPGSYVNLMAQDGNFNLGEYKKLENGWAKALDKGQSVSVRVELNYPQGGLRPDSVSVKTRIGSGPTVTNVFANAPGGRAPAAGSEPTGESTTARSAQTAAESATGGAEAARVSTLAKAAEEVGKIATPLAVAADAYSIYGAYKQDGNRIGSHTVDQAGSAAGGWAGAAVGMDVGAEAGAAVGAAFGGVGAVPGAVIGGAVGAVVGGVAGSGAGTAAVKLAADGVDLGKKAIHSITHLLGL